MLLIPNALYWSSRKCSCACALPAEVQLRLRVTRRSWQTLFAGNCLRVKHTPDTLGTLPDIAANARPLRAWLKCRTITTHAREIVADLSRNCKGFRSRESVHASVKESRAQGTGVGRDIRQSPSRVRSVFLLIYGVKILLTAQTQLRSYSEQLRAFGNSNICNCTISEAILPVLGLFNNF